VTVADTSVGLSVAGAAVTGAAVSAVVVVVAALCERDMQQISQTQAQRILYYARSYMMLLLKQRRKWQIYTLLLERCYTVLTTAY
jgi:hypothetical protein